MRFKVKTGFAELVSSGERKQGINVHAKGPPFCLFKQNFVHTTEGAVWFNTSIKSAHKVGAPRYIVVTVYYSKD